MNRVRELWRTMPATACGMLKMHEDAAFEEADRLETLELLPALHQARIAELGAGIGRFTGELAKSASHLTCVEFVPEFLEKNRAMHGRMGHIDFILADCREVEFPRKSLDFVFVNWLLQDLSDDEAGVMTAKIAEWLAPNGRAFFRETCAPFRKGPTENNPAIYRPRVFYDQLFQKYFRAMKKGNFHCWLEMKSEPFSCYWINSRP